MNERTAGDLERELAMLAGVRAYLREAEGPGFHIPTTAVDQVLDEHHRLDRTP
ncbi:hypothetical protein ACWEK5_21530 [Rhodococcus koreensis]